MSTLNYDKRPSDVIFDYTNYIFDSKNIGGNTDEVLCNTVNLLGGLFANQVSRGLQTEDAVNSFEAAIPGDYFAEGMGNTLKSVREQNTAALMAYEQSQPVKGFRR